MGDGFLLVIPDKELEFLVELCILLLDLQIAENSGGILFRSLALGAGDPVHLPATGFLGIGCGLAIPRVDCFWVFHESGFRYG